MTVTLDHGRNAGPRSGPASGRSPSRPTAPTAPWWLRVVGVMLAMAFAFPGAYLVWRNFTEGADPAGLLVSRRTMEPLARTLQLAVAVSISAMVAGTGLAWLTTRTDVPLARLWRILLPLPLVFPTFIGAAALIRTFNPGGLANDVLANVGIERTPELRGFVGAWYVLTLFTYPYVYLPVAAGFRQLSGSLEDSARVLGDGPWRIFRRICLPQVSSAIGAGTLLVFLYTVSDFGAVELLRYDTLTRAINTNLLANQPVALALSFILLLLAATVVVIERTFSRRMPQIGRHRASQPVVYPLGRWRIPATILLLIALASAVGGPMVALIDWSAEGLLRVRGGGRSLTIDRADVVDATLGTVQVSVIAAIVAVAAVLPIAYLVGRYRSRAGNLANAVIISTFALPGLLIALSISFWKLRSTTTFELLNDTMGLLIFAYVVRFGSLAMGVSLVAVRSVPQRLLDAAATLGAGRVRRLTTIDLPIMAPGLAAGGGLVLLSVMKELPITLLLSPLGFSSLATRMFLSFQDAFVAEAGIMAVVLVALSFVLSWFLVIRRADHL
ncbi:MAG: ABC transporter permease [Acidimicrobiales bacterium]